MKRLILVALMFVFLTGCNTDITPPTLQNIPESFEITVGDSIDLLTGINAFDNDLDLTEFITVNIEDTSILAIGTHDVIYTVIDESENIATVTVPINVSGIIYPELSIKSECGLVIDLDSDIPSLMTCILINDNDFEYVGSLVVDWTRVNKSIEGAYPVNIDYTNELGYSAETLTVYLQVTNFTDLSNFTYELNDTNDSYKIKLYSNSLIKDVIIPTYINYLPVTNIGAHSFSGKSLESVIIPETVTEIGAYAFGSNNLSTIVIPEGVTQIADYAFQYNNINAIVLPSNTTSIGKGSFSNNLLTEIILPSTLTSIGDDAFFMGNRIDSIIIPEGVTYIGDNAFAVNFSAVVTLPDSLITVGRNAFGGHLADEIYIGSNLESLDNTFGSGQEFDFTSNLGQRPFTYVVSPDNINFTQVDGVLFNKELTVLIDYPLNPRGSTYTVPSTVIEIGSGAFALQHLQEIIIPASVQYIGEGAFTGVVLDSLTLPSTILELERVAFLYSKIHTLYFELEIPPYEWAENALENIEVHDFIVNEDNPLYYDIDGVLFSLNTLIKYPTLRTETTYIIPEGTITLGFRSFSKSIIESLTIPASVIHMTNDVFFIGEVHLTEVIVLGEDPTRLNSMWEDAGFPIELKPSN